MIKTTNFNPETDPKLLCTCQHPECDKRSVTQEVLNKVQLIRNDTNRPLTINSGGRCNNHPDEQHRTTPADHQKGIGIDIAISGGIERDEIVRLGMKHGANAIGIAKNFIHLGWRYTATSVMWTYS